MTFDLAFVPPRLAKYIVLMPNGCWRWAGSLNTNGYGQVGRSVDGRKYKLYTHRLMYEIFIGPVPVRHDVKHSCWNRWCCYPGHLSSSTHRRNMMENRET